MSEPVREAATPWERIIARLFGRLVDPEVESVTKFSPNSPPVKGELLTIGDTISDLRHVRVSRCRVKWNGQEWRILELRVKEARRVSACP